MKPYDYWLILISEDNERLMADPGPGALAGSNSIRSSGRPDRPSEPAIMGHRSSQIFTPVKFAFMHICDIFNGAGR